MSNLNLEPTVNISDVNGTPNTVAECPVGQSNAPIEVVEPIEELNENDLTEGEAEAVEEFDHTNSQLRDYCIASRELSDRTVTVLKRVIEIVEEHSKTKLFDTANIGMIARRLNVLANAFASIGNPFADPSASFDAGLYGSLEDKPFLKKLGVDLES